MTSLPRNTILVGDAVTRLRDLPGSSVDCVVTSPPHFQLRNYGVDGQLGLELQVDVWVANLRAVMVEVARVLKPTASVWLNLGDSFSRAPKYGAPAKRLLLAPERLLLALAADGWIVRNKVIWNKPNPMPHSVGDRLNTSHELVYFLMHSPRYFFDLDAIREPHTTTGTKREQAPLGKAPAWAGPLAGSQDGLQRARTAGLAGHVPGKNPGDVWTIYPRLPRSTLRHLPTRVDPSSDLGHLPGHLHCLRDSVAENGPGPPPGRGGTSHQGRVRPSLPDALAHFQDGR